MVAGKSAPGVHSEFNRPQTFDHELMECVKWGDWNKFAIISLASVVVKNWIAFWLLSWSIAHLYCSWLLMISINEIMRPVCILFLWVGIILLQCQTTVAECRGNAADDTNSPRNICHHYISAPWNRNITIKPLTTSSNHCYPHYGNELNKWGQQICCCQLFARGVKGCGCHGSNRVTGSIFLCRPKGRANQTLTRLELQ